MCSQFVHANNILTWVGSGEGTIDGTPFSSNNIYFSAIGDQEDELNIVPSSGQELFWHNYQHTINIVGVGIFDVPLETATLMYSHDNGHGGEPEYYESYLWVEQHSHSGLTDAEIAASEWSNEGWNNTYGGGFGGSVTILYGPSGDNALHRWYYEGLGPATFCGPAYDSLIKDFLLDTGEILTVSIDFDTFYWGDEITPIPEPATMLLLGTGLVGVAGAARRKRKNQA